MLSGKSVFHTTQTGGLFWKKDSVRGYYSDLRHKVTDNNRLDSFGVPINVTSEGKQVYFPITIFQYGLGAYDLYLETKDEIYKEKFFDSVKWCMENQMECGAWNAFGWCDEKSIFSSMAQAEGISLLCRAFTETKDDTYLECAKKAVDFMLVPVEKGGTACYDELGNLLTLEESGSMKTVMNGMIFSIWGMYDYILCVPNNSYKEKMLLWALYCSEQIKKRITRLIQIINVQSAQRSFLFGITIQKRFNSETN